MSQVWQPERGDVTRHTVLVRLASETDGPSRRAEVQQVAGVIALGL